MMHDCELTKKTKRLRRVWSGLELVTWTDGRRARVGTVLPLGRDKGESRWL